jgi:hypothetical protein
MKFSRSILICTIALSLIGVLFVAVPAIPALADTAGPNFPGSGENLTGTGTEAWQTPGNIAASDTNYATVSFNKGNHESNYLRGSLYGFSIPEYATVTGIEVVINRKASSTTPPAVRDNELYLVKGTTRVGLSKATNTAWPATLGTATYGGPGDLWETTWTPTEVGTIGVDLSASTGNNGDLKTISVDYITVKVYYSFTSTTTEVDCGTGTPTTVYGDTINCVATVTGVVGGSTPTGTVSWSTNGGGTFTGSPCPLSPLSAGVASCYVDYTPTVVGTGTHTITASYGGAISFADSSDTQGVAVAKKLASVTPDAVSKTYGDVDPALTGMLTGFLTVDGVTASYSRTAGEVVAGSPYTISAVLSPSDVLANYDITNNTADFTIDRKPASVTPDTASKTYGNVDPTLTGTLVGFLTADNVVATYSRAAGETVAGSPYTISATLSPTGVLDNYDITSDTANFTITKRAVTVTADSKTKVLGQPDPVLTFRITAGSLTFSDAFTGALKRVAGESVGTYAILQDTLALNNNYTLSYAGANLTITFGNIYLPTVLR